MKGFRVATLWLALGAGSADAQPRIYAGDEAAALRCANMIALTGVALGGAKLISSNEREIMVILAGAILDRHVGGTRAQKLRALDLMQQRRSPEATLEDYRVNVQNCLARFPIN